MLATFTFTLDTDSKQATFAGNIDITEALNILQQLTISELVRREKEAQAVEQVGQGQKDDDTIAKGGD